MTNTKARGGFTQQAGITSDNIGLGILERQGGHFSGYIWVSVPITTNP